MARRVHIRVAGHLDRGAGLHEGTMTIDRAAGLITVRKLHCRTSYTLPLDKVADMICLRVIRANIFERRLEKARQRQARRAR